jgi:hypothetical protein
MTDRVRMLLAALALVFSTASAWAIPVFDPTFGTFGIASVATFGRVLALQPDGRILVAGVVDGPPDFAPLDRPV